MLARETVRHPSRVRVKTDRNTKCLHHSELQKKSIPGAKVVVPPSFFHASPRTAQEGVQRPASLRFTSRPKSKGILGGVALAASCSWAPKMSC